MISIGAVIQEKTRISTKADANAELYIGLGEPEKLIGAGVSFNIHGLSNKLGEQNNLGRGTLSFHFNRFFFENKLLFDVGLDNVYSWGGNKIYGDYITYKKSFYFSGNYLLNFTGEVYDMPFSYLSVTAGAGNGYFKTDKSYKQEEAGALNPFLSLATPVLKGTNFIAEWNGYDIGLGVSSIPYQKLPLMFRLEATDFIYGKPRYIASVSLPLQIGMIAKSSPRPIGTRAIRPARTI